MKKLIHFTLVAIACMAVACHKDGTLTTLGTVKFTTPLTTSTNNVLVTPADTGTTVVTFKWPAVVYPYKEQVTYTLIADIPADTLGATPWAKATTILIGNDILTKSFTGSALNTIAINVGIPANDTGKMVFRMQAYQDRNIFSNVVTVTVTPYAPPVITTYPSLGYPVLYLPGFYQGWSPSTAGTVAAPTAGFYLTGGVYEGYIYVPTNANASAYDFKFTSAPDWNHINYGNGGIADSLTTDGNAGDLVLPGPGLYELSANTTTLHYTASPITWAIIGDATPNGWGAETEMTFNPGSMTWTITLPMVTAGSFKFRADNAWNIDFGISPTDNRIYYADNPIFGGGGSKPGLNNMTVPANGTYLVTLYLGDPNGYHYTAVKQ